MPLLILIVASLALGISQVPQHSQVSPFDEYVYLDYLDKVPSQGLVVKGEETGELARNELSCRGVINYGSFGEACNRGAHDADGLYPYGGGTGADIYTPAYFAITWAIAQPLTWFGVSLFDAGRLAGAVWLAVGVSLLFLAMRRLRVPTPLGLALGLLVIASPSVYWSNTYLSTDAPSILVGAGLALSGIAIAQRSLSVWWLIPIAVFATLLKVQYLGAVGLTVLALGVWEYLRARSSGLTTEPTARTTPWQRYRVAIIGAVVVVSAVAAQAVWLVLRSRIALPTTDAPAIDERPMTIAALIDESFKFLLSAGTSGMPAGTASDAAGKFLILLSIAGVVGVALTAGARALHEGVIAWSTLLVALCMGPALAVAASGVAGYYFPLPLRYGLVLLPAFLICAALLARQSRWAHNVMLGVAGALTLAVIAS